MQDGNSDATNPAVVDCLRAPGDGLQWDAKVHPLRLPRRSPGLLLPPGRPVASLAVEAFTVIVSRNGEWFELQPALRLTETSGKSGAWVTSMNFQLDEIGPAGAVPPWQVKKRVDAGATRDMIDPDVYGDYKLLISGHTDAQRVSLVMAVATVSH